MPRLRKNAARNVDATVASRSAIFLTSLVAVCGTSHAADPVVPGFVTETYATVSGPVALSFAADGKLFVGRDVPGSPSGAETVKIHRVGVGGSPVVEYGDEGIPDPDGVLADSDGSLSGIAGSVLVVGDGGKLLAILPDESLVTLSPNPSGMSNPNYIERGRDGAVITDSGVQKVFGFEAPDTLTPLITSPSPPGFLAIDEDGRIFVTHSDGVIRLWDADGMLVDDSVGSTGSNYAPLDVAPGNEFGTDLYAMHPDTGNLMRIGDEQTTVAGSGFPASLGEIEFGPDGALYVSLFEEGRILRIYFCGRDCGDPVAPPQNVTASDAQFILRSAVGLIDCERCICDVDGSGVILSSDALRDLRAAVGLEVDLECPRPAPAVSE